MMLSWVAASLKIWLTVLIDGLILFIDRVGKQKKQTNIIWYAKASTGRVLQLPAIFIYRVQNSFTIFVDLYMLVELRYNSSEVLFD